MPKYEISLQEIMIKHKSSLTPEFILGIMISLMNSLEIIHKAGYTHNDIKFNNIMIDNF